MLEAIVKKERGGPRNSREICHNLLFILLKRYNKAYSTEFSYKSKRLVESRTALMGMNAHNNVSAEIIKPYLGLRHNTKSNTKLSEYHDKVNMNDHICGM